MVTEPAHAALADVLGARPDLPVYVVSPAVMKEVSGFNIHRGCLAIGERPPHLQWQEAVADARTVVVLERVANADNIGGIFRNAAAFGAGAVLLDEPSPTRCIAKQSGRRWARRLSSLSPAWVRWLRSITQLKRNGFATNRLDTGGGGNTSGLGGESMPVRNRSPSVLGHEGEGLLQETLRACEFHARIPTSSAVDSLNVASAARDRAARVHSLAATLHLVHPRVEQHSRGVTSAVPSIRSCCSRGFASP